MENINELIFRVNNDLRNNLEVDKNDIKKLLNIAMEMEKQLALCNVVSSLTLEDLTKIVNAFTDINIPIEAVKEEIELNY